MTLIRVLLVDDSVVLRRMAKNTLESLGGYVVHEAADPIEAFDLLSMQDFDAIITDYYMPGLDGIEFARRLRRIRSTENLPIILVTSERESFVVDEARSAGIDHTLTKPLDPTVLQRVLEECITQRRGSVRTPGTVTVQSLLDSFQFPVMIVDSERNVVLGNSSFWRIAGGGIDDRQVTCAEVMHPDAASLDDCPLIESARTGNTAERLVPNGHGMTHVTVMPLAGVLDRDSGLFLHLAKPVD
jgi:CheY-like chemotaxis protein